MTLYTYHGQVCIVVLGMHLVLLVLAALVVCVVISVGIVVPWSAPGAVNACCCTWQCVGYSGAWSAPICVGCMCVLWCLEHTWCYQCLLHLAPCVGCMCVLSAPGTVSACCTWHMCWLYVCIVVLGAHLVQEGSGPCKIQNLSIWSYGTHILLRDIALTCNQVIQKVMYSIIDSYSLTRLH